MAIHIYVGCTKVTIDHWDIRLSVTTSFIGYDHKNDYIDFHNQSCIVKHLLDGF